MARILERETSLISQRRSTTSNYYHFDGLGSTDRITDSGATVRASYAYQAFGTVVFSNGGVTNRCEFIGKFGCLMNPDTAYVDMRARVQMPSLGRFPTLDPLGLWLNKMNPYLYVQNRPTLLIDPSGQYEALDEKQPFPNSQPIQDYMKAMGYTCGVLKSARLYDSTNTPRDLVHFHLYGKGCGDAAACGSNSAFDFYEVNMIFWSDKPGGGCDAALEAIYRDYCNKKKKLTLEGNCFDSNPSTPATPDIGPHCLVNFKTKCLGMKIAMYCPVFCEGPRPCTCVPHPPKGHFGVFFEDDRFAEMWYEMYYPKGAACFECPPCTDAGPLIERIRVSRPAEK